MTTGSPSGAPSGSPTVPRTGSRSPVPRRLASTLLALVVPLVLLVGGGLAALAWADELPDPLAVHWDGAGRANGFGSPAGFALPLVGIGAVLAAMFWLIAVLLGREAATRRIASGVSVGMSAFLTVTMVGSLHVQRGLADAADAVLPNRLLVVGFAVSLVLGAIAAALMPGDAPQPASGRVSAQARVPLAAGERAVWTRTVTSPTGIAIGGGLAAGGVLLALTTASGPAIAPVLVLVGVLVVSATSFRVTVDVRGLRVRSVAGWPRTLTPLDEVVAVRTVHVNPLREFGGLGYRVAANGRTGWVLRAGPAVEVERTGGRTIVVTVDEAEVAAALLATLADRAR